MGYRLKDKELQKKLDEISNGNFTKQLAREIADMAASKLGFDKSSDRVYVDFGNPIRSCVMSAKFRACIEPGDLVDATEYDPSNWNNYPEVTPPAGIWMRTERRSAEGVVRGCLIFSSKDGGFWHDGSDVHQCDRFRPWED